MKKFNLIAIVLYAVVLLGGLAIGRGEEQVEKRVIDEPKAAPKLRELPGVEKAAIETEARKSGEIIGGAFEKTAEETPGAPKKAPSSLEGTIVKRVLEEPVEAVKKGAEAGVSAVKSGVQKALAGAQALKSKASEGFTAVKSKLVGPEASKSLEGTPEAPKKEAVSEEAPKSLEAPKKEAATEEAPKSLITKAKEFVFGSTKEIQVQELVKKAPGVYTAELKSTIMTLQKMGSEAIPATMLPGIQKGIGLVAEGIETLKTIKITTPNIFVRIRTELGDIKTACNDALKKIVGAPAELKKQVLSVKGQANLTELSKALEVPKETTDAPSEKISKNVAVLEAFNNLQRNPASTEVIKQKLDADMQKTADNLTKEQDPTKKEDLVNKFNDLDTQKKTLDSLDVQINSVKDAIAADIESAKKLGVLDKSTSDAVAAYEKAITPPETLRAQAIQKLTSIKKSVSTRASSLKTFLSSKVQGLAGSDVPEDVKDSSAKIAKASGDASDAMATGNESKLKMALDLLQKEAESLKGKAAKLSETVKKKVTTAATRVTSFVKQVVGQSEEQKTAQVDRDTAEGKTSDMAIEMKEIETEKEKSAEVPAA